MDINLIAEHGLESYGYNLDILINDIECDMEFKDVDVVTSQHSYSKLSIWEGRRKWARKIIPQYLLKSLALEYRKHPEAKLYLLCHSNATFGIMNALILYYYTEKGLWDRINIDKLFLFGCVIPRKFDWNDYPEIDVYNFVGTKDRVSSMSRFYGMGNSGQKGFKIDASNLTQYYNKWRHSDFVSPKYRDYIKSIIMKGL